MWPLILDLHHWSSVYLPQPSKYIHSILSLRFWQNCRYAPIIWNSLRGPWKGFSRSSYVPWTSFGAAELPICPIIEVYAQRGLCLMTLCPKGTCLLTGCLKGNFKQYAFWLDSFKGIFSYMPYDWMPRREMPFDRMPIYCTALFSDAIFSSWYLFKHFGQQKSTYRVSTYSVSAGQ